MNQGLTNQLVSHSNAWYGGLKKLSFTRALNSSVGLPADSPSATSFELVGKELEFLLILAGFSRTSRRGFNHSIPLHSTQESKVL